MMALHRYFKTTEKLPNPRGPLSKRVPSKSIVSANEAVRRVIEDADSPKPPRGPYVKFLPEQKAEIGKRAAEHGVAATARYYNKRFPGISESSVRTWRNAYTTELKKKRREGSENLTVESLPEKKRGRPLLLGEELEMQVRAYLTALCENGAVVNTAIAIGCAEGIVKSKDSNLLASNGGHIALSKHWGKHFLTRMGYVKRRASTKAKVLVQNFEEVKAQFLLDIKVVVEMDDIPFDLVINWDQTGIHYVPVGSWTMEKEGSKRVEIVAVDDKRQITAVFAGSLTGDFLPPQLIYQGTTQRCLPPVKFPPEWHITHSHNHWSNESTMKGYIEKIILPYITKKKEELKLQPDHPALVIFDKFTGQGTESLLELLEDNNIHVVMVPPNCTDRLQPLDVSVNKPAKTFLRQQFHTWYAEQICRQLQKETDVSPVDLRLSRVKPLGAQWMIDLYNYFQSKPEIIQNGFRAVGIVDCLSTS